jgi:hypothetical protein
MDCKHINYYFFQQLYYIDSIIIKKSQFDVYSTQTYFYKNNICTILLNLHKHTILL